MSDYQGNIIIKNPATPTGPSAYGSAPGMWKLNEVAYWIKQGVWPNPAIVPDQYFPYVSLLLSTTSLGNANNNLMVDSSSAFNPVSRFGNTAQGSFTPYATNWSNYFGATGQYLSAPYSSAFNLTGDFTVECWINPGNLPSTTGNAAQSYERVFSFGTYNAANSIGLEINSNDSGNVRKFICWYNGTSYGLSSNNAVSPGNWYHIALVRSGTVITLYINGTSTGLTITGASAAVNTSQALYIASLQGFEGDASAAYNGYISNFRVVKGTAVYTANFTVPTAPLTAITNTSLLTCQSNRFRDASTNNLTLTVTGNTSVQDFNPFSPAYPGLTGYNQSDITNWSGYFDGSGDYVDFPSTSGLSGSGNFTIQAFIYPTTVAGDCCIYETRGGTGWVWFINSGGYLQVYDSTATLQTASTTQLRANQWTHVALVKNGSTCTYYVNGASAGTFTLSSFAAASRVRIGARNDAAATYFGYISNLRTDTAALTITVPTSNLSAVGTTTLLTLQNAAFTDNSTNNAIATINGNATVTGNSPFNTVGYWSNYFDGTDDAVVAPNTPANFGSSNFTAECWVMFTTNSIGYQPIMANQGSGDAQGWIISTETNNRLYFYYSISGSSWAGSIDTGITPTVGVWTHLAVVRNSSTFTFYVNGVASGTSTNSSALHSPSGNFRAGRYLYYPGGARTLNGWISNVRLVNGTAVYTGNFTPSTTPLTAITNTSLLTCQSSRFVDTSANAYSITIEGNPQVQSFDPFYTATIASNGGSMYFDGSGDWLQVPRTPLVIPTTNDFTLECWMYPTTNSSGQHIMGPVESGTTGDWGMFRHTDNTLGLYVGSTGADTYGGTSIIRTNQWNHVALSRVSGTLYKCVNGAIVSVSFPSSLNNNTSYPLTIAADNNGDEAFYTGWMAGIRIINGTGIYSGSSYTVPTSPYGITSNTTLLINGMNAGIYDATTINDMETVGNAQVTTAVSKYGGSSVYFDGSGDYLAVPPNSQSVLLGTASFTVEFWINPNSSQPSTRTPIVSFGNGFTTNVWAIQLNNTSPSYVNRIQLWAYNLNSGAVVAASTGTISASTWTHVAVVRNGSNFTIYINGVADGTGSSSASMDGGSTTLQFQVGYNSPDYYAGYIDDLRITKGVARYTSNFTPPTQAFPTY